MMKLKISFKKRNPRDIFSSGTKFRNKKGDNYIVGSIKDNNKITILKNQEEEKEIHISFLVAYLINKQIEIIP